MNSPARTFALLFAGLFSSPAAAPPARIVSTTPGITEILFKLGAGERVVGVTNYCRFPEEARRKQKIGTFLQPNLEAITSLRPDLVVIQQNPVNLAGKMKRLGLPVLELEMWDTAGILTAIETLGRRIGEAQRGAEVTAAIRAGLNEIRSQTAGRPRRTMMFVVGRSPGTLEGLIVVGKASYLSELIDAAGGVNIFAGAAAAYPKVTLEEIIARDPDVIIDMGEMGGSETLTPAAHEATLKAWTKMAVLRAVREKRVYPVASDVFVVPGPRMAEAARQFARMLHPEVRW